MDYNDEIGKKYGKLTILEILPAVKNKTRCRCRCECGNVKEFNLHDLKSGNTATCGQCSIYNMIGKKFNHLTVISYEGSGTSGHRMYKCLCDCGNEIVVSGTRLRNNKIQSCGKCISDNEIGKQYGQLTVLNYAYSKNQKRYWKCKCTCGNIVEVSTDHLHSGHTQSCGCIKSHGELYIQEILKKYNINYEKEVSFEDLKDNKVLRFDFAVQNKTKLIEFDGEQHYYASEGWGGKDKLSYIQEHDKQKDIYCIINHIPLLRLSYKMSSTEIEDAIKKFLDIK